MKIPKFLEFDSWSRMRENCYEIAQPSIFRPGDMVLFHNAFGLKTDFQGYLAKYGSGPHQVLRTKDVATIDRPSGCVNVPPQVIIQTKIGEHQFGQGWFVLAPKLGEICQACGHKYECRALFSSVEETPSCWCPS